MKKVCPSCNNLMDEEADFLVCSNTVCNTKISKQYLEQSQFHPDEQKERFLESHKHSTRGYMSQKCPVCHSEMTAHGKNMVCTQTTCEVKVVNRTIAIHTGDEQNSFGDIPYLSERFLNIHKTSRH